MPQEIFLSDDSISANVAFGIPESEVDAGAVEKRARMAQIHDFVAELPDAYDTIVGERGVRLSGGQRQRIGIARACITTRRCSCSTRPRTRSTVSRKPR